MTNIITNEMRHFSHDLTDMTAEFLHTHSDLWPQVKADAADNDDHLAILNAALLVRNNKWDVTTTLTQKWNAMRCRPVGLHECRTDAERDAWQVGFEHGARSDFTGGNNPEDLLEGLQPDLHEIAREGWWAGNAMQQMPWTRNQFTPEQTRQCVASRKEAGAAIDIETCEFHRWYADAADRYGVNPDCEMQSMGRTHYVRSPTSNGWIETSDLPGEKIHALNDRFERNQGLWEAACAVHPMFEAGGLRRWNWKGEGEEPSPDAMREWFKVNHPTLASEAEREIRARIKEKREQAVDFEPPF